MLLLLLILALLLNGIAYKKGFYKLPEKLEKDSVPLPFSSLLIGFAIYLIIAQLIAPFFARFLFGIMRKMNPEMTSLPITMLTAVQVGAMLLSFFLLQMSLQRQRPALYRKVWKDHDRTPNNPIEGDFGLGVFTWLLSFPLVSVLGEVIDLVLKKYGVAGYEQTAVKFVKAAMDSPFALIFAFLSVLVFAPLIEEYLFRGLLQSYCRKWLGSRSAILISALSFALFHYWPGQGYGNIPLLLSLFLLGGFLGFLYERQGSLWAPIGLHFTFNAVSALRILFFPEAS